MSTAEDLETAVGNGGYIKLTSDITSDKCMTVKAGETVVLDLNGQTLTGTNKDNPFDVAGNFTLADSSTGGKIVASTPWGVFYTYKDSSVTINGGTIEYSGSRSAIYDSIEAGSNISITGGTINGNAINSSIGTVSITGGTFSSDVSAYVASGTNYGFLDDKFYVGSDYATAFPEGNTYVATEIDDTTKYYTTQQLAENAKAAAIASVGDMLYSSLQKAVTASKSGDTIEMLRDVELDSGWINIQQKEITLDLKGKNISTNDTAVFTVMPKSTLKATDTKTATNIPATSLTINNTGGDNSGSKGSIKSKDGWAITVVGDGNKEHAPSLIVNGGYIESDYGISGIGNVPSDETNPNIRDDRYINVTINDGKIVGTENPGVYFPGEGTLNINGGEITGASGIEIRAGSLNVTGGTITATGTEYNSVGNSNGSTSSGVGIAIAQHTTKKAIEVKISGEPEISGAVALGVANPQSNDGDSGEIEVNIDGGTFTSTGTDEAAISAQNSDERVSINISSGTFNGELKSTFATTSDGKSAAIKITGEVTVTDSEGKTKKYDANSLQYDLGDGNYQTVAEGWNAVGNKWIYFVRESVGSVAAKGIAYLTPASEDEDETTLKLTITQEFGGTVELDFNSDLFKGAKYTTVDASSLTADYPLKITAGDVIKNIIGGAGNDTLTASSLGAVLNGGEGDNLLQGGDGEDTFIHTAGTQAAPVKDTIDNYNIANDIVSLTNELPTDLATGISYNTSSSEFVVSLGGGAGDSLTFHSASEIKLKFYNGTGDDTYYYRADRVIKNNKEATLGALFSDKTFDLNKLSSDYVTYSSVATIDASAVTVSGGLNIIANTVSSSAPNFIKSAQTGGTVIGGNNDNTLISAVTGEASLTFRGGEGNDSLVGGVTSKDLFVYTGGTDTVSGYASDDIVRVNNGFKIAEATYSVGSGNISLGWGGTDNLIFQSIEDNTAVTVQQGTGNNYYNFTKDYIAHNKGITLAAGYTGTFDGAAAGNTTYETINAAAVTAANGISIVGNDNANYIFGPTAVNASIYGGANNDKINVSERGNSAKYLFEFTEGKDEVIGFDATKDTVSVAVDRITAAKLSNSNSKLTLTVNKNKDVLTLRSEDEIEKVSLQSGGYLTKDGYVDGHGFSLFGSAKGQIDLNDALYKGSNISLVAADSVKSQSVTLTGGADGGTFIYAENNKKRDGFVYGGGSATIVNYEAGRDRIDLGSATLTSFTVNDTTKEVILKVGEGTISIAGAKGQEVLLHDTSKGNGYKKMVFAQTGVIENKQKNPTMATVSGAATGYSAIASPTVKKIFVTGLTAAASIQAGNKNNTVIDASEAAQAVTLSGDAKNDKLIGSAHEDTFIYTAGKDIIQDYSGGDSISIGDFESSLSSAKITAGSKSIKFQFNNKNTLTIKANNGETLGSALTIGDTNYTYTKNAIESGGQATLTNAFSGTFNTNDSKLAEAVTTVDGAAVSKNLTYKGSTAAESLVGGTKKTTFKGGGGQDSLVGGTGKDVFFYAKGDAGTTTIANFDFGSNGRAGNDKLKIASGTIGEISTIEGGVQFAMNSGKKGDTSNIGWFNVTSGTPNQVAIKANNTLYWFNQASDAKDVNGNDVAIGQLITSDSRVSASDVSNLDIIDLNYSTNLAKAGVAVKVTGAKPTT